jgi:hypothetical protein
MGQRTKVQLTSWNRFHTRNLTVAPELLGQSHTFTFDGRAVDVLLPSAEKLPEKDDAPDDEPIGRFIRERIAVSNWRRGQDGRWRAIDVHIENVDVVVDVPGRTAVPEEALTRPANAFELFPEQQQKRLDKLASDCGNLAGRAFDLWIRTLRWKADDWRIGLPEMSGVETGWGTYLREKNTGKDVWIESARLYAYAPRAVTTEIWDEVAAALNAGQPPPIFYDLLYAAMAHLERGELQRVVVDAAVAAETYMRNIVRENLPTDLDDRLKEYINNAPIWRVRDQFFPQRLNAQQWKEYKDLLPDLRNLFDDRNTILHSGQRESLTAQYCERLINSVRTLLALVP